MFAEKIDENAQILSGERQLKLYGKFLESCKTFIDRHSPGNDVNFDYYQGVQIGHVSRNIHFPIKLDFSPCHENASLFQLIESENKILNKIIMTFAQLCEDGAILVKESNNYKLQFMYMDRDLCMLMEAAESGIFYTKISQSLDSLSKILFLVKRCTSVANAILQQLGVFSEQSSHLLGPQFGMRIQAVFDILNSVILQIIAFDEIICASSLCKSWTLYKKALNSAADGTIEASSLKNVIDELEILFSGNLFQIFLDKMIKLKKCINTDALGTLSGFFRDYIRISFNTIEQFASDISELNETEAIIKINVICVLYQNFFGNLDQKYFKQLVDCNTKYAGITLFGNIIWRPEVFLKKYACIVSKENDKYFTDSIRLRQTYLSAKVKHLLKEGKQYCRQVTMWTLELDSILKTRHYDSKLKESIHTWTLFHQGLQLAGQLSQMIKCLTNLHISLLIPMQKATLISICKLIEYLQIIQITFNKNADAIAETIFAFSQYSEYKALHKITIMKKKIAHEKYDEHNLDTLSSLHVADKCMQGPPTDRRLLITNLALSFANQNRLSPLDITETLYRLQILNSLQDNITKLCDSTFLYWHQSVLMAYFKRTVYQKTEYHLAKYLVKSSNDCRKYFQLCGINDLALVDTHERPIIDQYKNEVIVKLYSDIETFLRIEVHADLQQDKQNPFVHGVKDYREVINMGPLQFSEDYVISKDYIENYLTNTFYNLTTVSLHNWKTYDEMRHLASHKFNLDTIQNHLPVHTLEQGIDVLEIMRNIHIFVSKYLYDMSKQVFVAQASNSKYLNTIGIKHIANSLRTHGIGVINTTVNCTYQFLRKKFYTFSQFMYDEHIKSRLVKDLKYFRDDKDKLSQTYSYDRAESFNKKIRKLGLSADGQSYLDLFRQLITHIGNAMGYVRLILSGGIRAGFATNLYLPKLDESIEITEAVTQNQLSDTTITAAAIFNKFLQNLSNNFSESSEYFRLLVRAFTTSLRDEKNHHLCNFYLIIPPLTINFVEYITSAKDKINKRDKQGALFADDGFAIGLAYILKLLNQTSEFNSLDWFKLVREHYFKEKQVILKVFEEVVNFPTDKKLQETLSLTEKRIDAYEMEFKLLNYNLKSSTIFFQ